MASNGNLEWRVNMGDGTTEILRPQASFMKNIMMRIKDFIWGGLLLKAWKFLEKAWGIANSEPKKVVHGLKVGLALTIVSIFYYMRPLYEGVGGNAMWAIMTVVVTFESTVGATFYKCVNRVIGTSLAGCLGIGVHWIAAESASAATFSRFIPSVKSRFDYGAMIFVLTFCLVSISGYRVEKLLELARTRISTIAIGTSLCIFVSMLFCPIWAGSQLQSLTARNLDKLALSLDGCVCEYFENDDDTGEMKNEDQKNNNSKVEGYKCVLNSKASEESMAPNSLKLHLAEPCKALSSSSSQVLKELSIVIKKMKKSTKIDFLVSNMNIAVQELQNAIKSLPSTQMEVSLSEQDHQEANNEDHHKATTAATIPPLMELLPLATLVSLLIETTSRIEHVVNAVETLANVADYDSEDEKKKPSSSDNHDHNVAMRVFPEA
ncbi:aluminum-activated malate transporter 10 [Cucumis melo var. makuwa]|uniref:Aluminum-activated malate transporter 10 n=1 Tax=Cucumis melo var. makuwa TaxID=1194695 RepID=A0A5A7TE87_CUCMM|nr:aluminum-activated malate transporter 10 [Cucumis melo var. makuwa]TYK24731.1 aluminum-activated malate transporter 10 [Cucumis melo var. makuwa]